MTNADSLVSRPFNPSEIVVDSNRLFERDSSFDTLPHDNPFVTDGLRYAAPAVEWDVDRQGRLDIYSPTSSFTFAVQTTGNLINTLFPQAALIASQQLTVPCALLAVSLSYAIRNTTFAGAIGMYVLIDNRPIISVAGNSDMLVGTITPTTGASSNWSDVRSNSYSLDVAPLIQANQSVSLYASCANQVTDIVWGIVTFKYVVL